jgi:tRNA dimethylallyltransferase
MTTKTASDRQTVLIVCGPTAAGKTKIAVQLALEFNGEVISADSRQFYREMSIGTAKPTEDEMCGIPHYFVGSETITQPISAGEFERQGEQKIHEISEHGKLPIVVGGSGLFINALIHGLDDLPKNDDLRQELIDQFEKEGIDHLIQRLKGSDPDAAKNVDMKNPVRIMRAIELVELSGESMEALRNQEKVKKDHIDPIWIGIDLPREELYDRINQRVDIMISQGLEEEAKQLLPQKNLEALKTVGYRELFDYFEGKHTSEEAVRLIKRNSRHYAKRQLTWFRKNEEINWFSPHSYESIRNFVGEYLTKKD